MHRHVMTLRLLVILALAGALSTLAPPAAAQVLIPPEALESTRDVETIFEKGATLERQRRWSDVLSLYEKAFRSHPDRLELKRHLNVARGHLDVARRYADRSFLTSLARLAPDQALEVYDEVLLKVETYHVHDPNWSSLIEQGISGLQIASTEPSFVDQFPQPVSTGQWETWNRTIRSRIRISDIKSRQQVKQTTSYIAQLTAEQLGIPPTATVLEFTCAAVSSLDRYSAFLTGDQLDEVFSQIEGNFVGLGIELKSDGQTLLIVNVIPGGPAAQAGIRDQDRIVVVDGKPLTEVSTDAAADLLKGPELSYVDLVILRPSGEKQSLHIQRRRVDVPSVQDIQMLDAKNGIAYLKLASFQKTTSRDMDNALWTLHRQGMRSLVMDVRGNPGGLLNASVEVADKFLTAGAIVSTRGRSSREDFDYKAHNVGTWRVPLIVLIDGDSASASEIFAGAIHDQHRGTVVGQRSYGKGSVQGIFPLSRYKAGIRLTTAKFYAPSGQPISHHGVYPDVIVNGRPARMAARPDADGNFPQLRTNDPVVAKALELARRTTQKTVRRAQ